MESPQETGFLFLVSFPAIKMGPEAPWGFQAHRFPKEYQRQGWGNSGLCWQLVSGRLLEGDEKHPDPLNRAGFLDLPLEGSCSGMGGGM